MKEVQLCRTAQIVRLVLIGAGAAADKGWHVKKHGDQGNFGVRCLLPLPGNVLLQMLFTDSECAYGDSLRQITAAQKLNVQRVLCTPVEVNISGFVDLRNGANSLTVSGQ